MDTKKRYDWVDAAKGISIILVVMMYAAHNVGKYTGETGFLHYVIGFATPFRMPEFFLISGLFLSQVIGRDWKRYADRRVVHYFYFYAVWVAINIVLKVGIAGRDPGAMLSDLAVAVVQPYGVFWFIYMLGVFSLAAKLAWQFRLPHWLVIAAAAGLQLAPIDVASYAVTQFCAYFVFFYLGYAASPLIFRFVEGAAARPLAAVLGLAAWAAAEAFLVFWPDGTLLPLDMKMGYAAFPPLHLTLAVIGAIALCVGSALLTKFTFMDWLRRLGQHSLAVYLAFTLPMSAIRIIAMKTGLTDTSLLSSLVLVGAVSAPVVLYLIVKRTGIATFLFERPAWAHIPGTPGSRNPAPVAAPAE
ncbi:acyltransferase family protein [Oricola thermophila]|uniref:Acyltransferase family protein n=1 Tax=Oricola thermophila TaxID=2742145 RepID=A0A6N1VAS0_9HYPH|nr:acyltransferase family protein [Oricola thermophila]QKV18044.1 acyltransferase family protein [Oricola thermophila]